MENDMDHDSETRLKETEMDIDGPIITSPLEDNTVPSVTTGTSTSSMQPLSGLSRLFQGQSTDAGAIPGVLEGSIPYAQTLVGEDSSSATSSTSALSSSSSSSSSPGKHTIPFAEQSQPKRPTTDFLPPNFPLLPQTTSLPPPIRPNNTYPIRPQVPLQEDSSPREWMRHLYSHQAGTSTPIKTLLQKLDRNGLGSDIVWNQLKKYGHYELESYTFLQEIIPNLFLGSLLALDSEALKEAGITRVLSVMTSNPHKSRDIVNGIDVHGIAREYIMMRDVKTFQSHPWYQTTSAIIDSALSAGERILIHCRMGISRSATVVAAYLTFRHGFTPVQSLAWLKFQRPIVHPNSGFQEQLHDYYSVLQIDHPGEQGYLEEQGHLWEQGHLEQGHLGEQGHLEQGSPQGGHLAGTHEDNQVDYSNRQISYSGSRTEITPGFGWRGLTMCSEIVIDEERERRKRERRIVVESIREKWKHRDDGRWVTCNLKGWNEDVEKFVQRRISGWR